MHKKQYFILLTAVLAVVLALTGAYRLRADGGEHDGGGNGQHEGDDNENEAKGTLVAVDTTNMTVTVSTASGNVVIAVTDGTRIAINDQTATPQDLADFLSQNPGAGVEVESVTLNGQQIATHIQVDTEGQDGGGDNGNQTEVTGTLTAIDVNAGTVTIEQDGGAGTLVLTVDVSTHLEVDGAELTLDQLAALIQPGQTPAVKVEYDPSTNVVHKLEVEIQTEDENDDVVTGVNPGSNTLTVKPGGLSAAARSRPVKLQLLPGTIITRRNKVVRLRQVKPGDHVRVRSFLGRRGRRLASRVDVTRTRR